MLSLGLSLRLYASGVDSGAENLCMQIDYDGSKWYGYIYGLLGSADPETTNDGQIFYSFIWDADGNFVMQFGLNGDEQVQGASSIFIYSTEFKKGRLALWNAGGSQYEFTDLQLATDLITAFNNGKREVCLYIGVEDGLVIHYDYDDRLIGKVSYKTTLKASDDQVGVINLTWTAVEASDATYELFRDGTSFYTGTDTSISDSVLSGSYFYTIKVYDGNGIEKYTNETTGVAL